MIQQMVDFFLSFFAKSTAWGIGLAIVFGAIWLICYWPPLFRKPWLWAVLASSAILTLVAIAFIQIPLRAWSWQVMSYFWSQEILVRWFLLTEIPGILLSALVQEGSKLVPVVVYWWRMGKNIAPKLGLVIGAVAAVGFEVFEAQSLHNAIFASGWTWQTVQTQGVVALAGFWGRFFTMAFHTAALALAGYGLAKGWGWQFYLLASFLHALLNYVVLFFQLELVSIVQVEILITVLAMLVTAGALWLRWKKSVVIATP